MAINSNAESSGLPSTPAAAVVDAEMDALLERVQVLVPCVSPETTARTVKVLEKLHDDARKAHAALRSVGLRSQVDGSSTDDESNLGEAVAELGFDDSDDAQDEHICEDCSEEDDSGDSSSDSQPPSPGTLNRRARREYERRKLQATAAQRRRGVPSLVSAHVLQCRSCRGGGEIAEGACEAAKMIDPDNPRTDDIREVITTDMPIFEACDSDAEREVACRSSRYALYRRFIAWKFEEPVGAGKRKRLPDYCVWQIRFLFPDPRCDESCDMLRECERKGHYVGFRSAAESRAQREGVTLIDLEYHD